MRARRQIGDKINDFTIMSRYLGRVTLRCICGRIRVYRQTSLRYLEKTRLTCGCNGIDQIAVQGDPNLPTGVETYGDLVRWAGDSSNAHSTNQVQRHGLRHAIITLAAKAERTHPGEGWRVLRVLPYPAAYPPAKKLPKQTFVRTRENQALTAIQALQAKGVTQPEDIASAMNQSQVSPKKNGWWRARGVLAVLQGAGSDPLVVERQPAYAQRQRQARMVADAKTEVKLLSMEPKKVTEDTDE